MLPDSATVPSADERPEILLIERLANDLKIVVTLDEMELHASYSRPWQPARYVCPVEGLVTLTSMS